MRNFVSFSNMLVSGNRSHNCSITRFLVSHELGFSNDNIPNDREADYQINYLFSIFVTKVLQKVFEQWHYKLTPSKTQPESSSFLTLLVFLVSFPEVILNFQIDSLKK